MSLIDDAVACGARRKHVRQIVTMCEVDLARLRAMWLEEFRGRCAQFCDDLNKQGDYIYGDECAAAIRAMPLDNEAT